MAVESATSAAARGVRRFDAAKATLAVVALFAGLLLLYAGRHLTFFYDEWTFILYRRGNSLDTYLTPHNGHFSLFPVVVYKLLLGVVGMRHYWPYRSVVILLHMSSGVLLYVIARRRIGAWLAILPATLLLFLGSAWEDLLWAFQMGFLGAVAAGLGAIALLDREVRPPPLPHRRPDLGACALLTVSLASSGVGIAFLASAAALLLARRTALSRLWIVIVPAVLFAIWYLGWGASQQISSQAILGAPQYVVDAASSAAAGVVGLSQTYGPPLVVVLLLGLIMRLRRRALSPLLLAALVGAIVFWSLSAVTRADVGEPAASRYVYIGVTFLLLASVESVSGLTLKRSIIPGLVVLAVGMLVANVGQLRAGERGLRSADTPVRASLRAVEIAGDVVAPSFSPEPTRAPQLRAGVYLAATRAFGSPAFTTSQLLRAPDDLRSATDSVLERAERLAGTPVHGGVPDHPLAVAATTVGSVFSHGNCVAFSAHGPQNVLDLGFSTGQRLLVEPSRGQEVSVYLRRFASGFSEPPFTRLAAASEISFPIDLAPKLPWQVRLTSSVPFRACGV